MTIDLSSYIYSTALANGFTARCARSYCISFRVEITFHYQPPLVARCEASQFQMSKGWASLALVV